MKDLFFTDEEIQNMIDEPKQMALSIHSILHDMKVKSGRAASMWQNSHNFPRINEEGEWNIYLRLSTLDKFNFSCGLGFIPRRGKKSFTLMRYNGRSHQHTNRLEKESTFYDFHIHIATERYQRSSYKSEHYAKPTDRYADFNLAFKCLLDDCKITTNSLDDKQMRLFE